jgi:hypothetical protein
MITDQDVEYFNNTIDELDRAILDVTLFNEDVWEYYLNLVQKHAEFQRAFKFKVLPDTARAYQYFNNHFDEFVRDLLAIAKSPDLKQQKLFMSKIYYDIRTLSLELQTIQLNLRGEKPTLDLLLKFPNWLYRHHQNGDFYDYAWVYDKITEIENEAPKFFSLFQNEFNEMRNLAMNPNIPDKVKRDQMDNLVNLLIRLDTDMLRESVA